MNFLRLRDRLIRPEGFRLSNVSSLSHAPRETSEKVVTPFITENGIPLKKEVSTVPYILDVLINEPQLPKAMTPLRQSQHLQSIRPKSIPRPLV